MEGVKTYYKQHHNIYYDVVYTMAVLVHIDNEERECIYDYLKLYAKHVIFIEARNEDGKQRGGRLFNTFDYHIHMTKRNFTIISRTRATGDLGVNYDTIILKTLTQSFKSCMCNRT